MQWVDKEFIDYRAFLAKNVLCSKCIHDGIWFREYDFEYMRENPSPYTLDILRCSLTQWSLVTAYGVIEHSQHWFMWWLVAWRHQAITWIIVDFSSLMLCDRHLKAISQRVHTLLFCIMSLKIIFLKLLPYHPWANELTANTLRPRQSCRNFADNIFKCHFSMNIFVFWLKFHWNLFWRIQFTMHVYIYASIGLDNSFAPNRRQAIIGKMVV